MKFHKKITFCSYFLDSRKYSEFLSENVPEFAKIMIFKKFYFCYETLIISPGRIIFNNLSNFAVFFNVFCSKKGPGRMKVTAKQFFDGNKYTREVK